jgi:aspartate-alanine antiporter
MELIQQIAKNAPEAFLFLAIAVGAALGRVRIRGIAIGMTACTLIVSVILGQFGAVVISPILKSVFFGFFVFTIGFRSGPQFFASLSFRTLAQVVMALFIGACGLAIILVLTYYMQLDAGTAAGLGAGALTQSSMLGTASGALDHLSLSQDSLNQHQANLAAGYAITYVSGYILVLLFVPLVAPILMGIDLKDEAAKLEAALSVGAPLKQNQLCYRKFQVRAFRVSTAAGLTIGEIEKKIGRRATIERLMRRGSDFPTSRETPLQAGDEILFSGPSSVLVVASATIGTEIEGQELMSTTAGQVVTVYVTSADLHGRSLAEIVDKAGESARGIFLRTLTRHGHEVPLGPQTRVYIGDIMTLVGVSEEVERVARILGQIVRTDDRTDIAFICMGLAIGWLVGLVTYRAGTIPLTLGGAGGALISGLVCGWLHGRKPTIGAYPPAAQQTLSDLGLSAFIAAIGLANGPAALQAIQLHGLALLGAGVAVTLVPMIAGTLFAYHILRMNPVIICGALAGAMTVDAAVSGTCEVAKSQTPVLGVAVPYAISNVVLTMIGPIIIALTFVH